jgi:hypothetical protein
LSVARRVKSTKARYNSSSCGPFRLETSLDARSLEPLFASPFAHRDEFDAPPGEPGREGRKKRSPPRRTRGEEPTGRSAPERPLVGPTTLAETDGGHLSFFLVFTLLLVDQTACWSTVQVKRISLQWTYRRLFVRPVLPYGAIRLPSTPPLPL